MFEKIKKLAGMARDAAGSAAVSVGDLNGDGVVDKKDAQTAAEWVRTTAGSAVDEAGRLGKEAMRSDMVKDAASGAAIGAVVAVPLPVVGPIAGAAVGAGLGVYKNLTKKTGAVTTPPPMMQVDVHAQLLKLADLRDKGILNTVEFEEQKRKLLRSGDV